MPTVGRMNNQMNEAGTWPALLEGLGIFALGLLGSDALYGAELGSLPWPSSVAPAVIVAVGVVAHRLEPVSR